MNWEDSDIKNVLLGVYYAGQKGDSPSEAIDVAYQFIKSAIQQGKAEGIRTVVEEVNKILEPLDLHLCWITEDGEPINFGLADEYGDEVDTSLVLGNLANKQELAQEIHDGFLREVSVPVGWKNAMDWRSFWGKYGVNFKQLDLAKERYFRNRG